MIKFALIPQRSHSNCALFLRILLQVLLVLPLPAAATSYDAPAPTIDPSRRVGSCPDFNSFKPTGGTIQGPGETISDDRPRSPIVLVASLSSKESIDGANAPIDPPKESGDSATLQQRRLQEIHQTGAWWQRHLLQVTLIISFLLVLTLPLTVWFFILLRQYRLQSKLLEQSLGSTTELVSDIDRQRQQAKLYLEISGAMMVGLDRSGRIDLVNQRGCELLGYSQEELIGRDWFETCLPEEWRENNRKIFTDILADGSEKYPVFDGKIVTRTGQLKSIQWNNSLQRNEEGGIVGTLSSGIDITPRIEALNELSASRERFKTLYIQFESLLHGISEPLLIIGRDLNLLWANDAARDNWFFSDSVRQGRTCQVLDMCRQLCEDKCIIERCFRDNQELSQIFYHSSGRSIKIRVFPDRNENGSPHSVIMLAQDITEILKIRTEMARAAQLASVGELAANVAHEINNPLHGIINYAEILKSKTDDPDMTRDLLSRIANEGERISRIVRNLLSYTRLAEDKPEPVTLPTIIQSVDMLLGHKLKSKNILVDLDIPDDLPLVRASSNQLQQVFVNLFGNAHDALLDKEFAESEQRSILVRARHAGEMVEVYCEDNGTGIAQSALNLVFESFYSTKPVGRGTGLGLSISKSIIEEHGGEMRIESEEGEWTRVNFTVPLFKQSDIIQPSSTD